MLKTTLLGKSKPQGITSHPQERLKSNNMFRRECEVETPIHCWWDYKMVEMVEIVWQFLKMLNIELTCEPAFHS